MKALKKPKPFPFLLLPLLPLAGLLSCVVDESGRSVGGVVTGVEALFVEDQADDPVPAELTAQPQTSAPQAAPSSEGVTGVLTMSVTLASESSVPGFPSNSLEYVVNGPWRSGRLFVDAGDRSANLRLEGFSPRFASRDGLPLDERYFETPRCGSWPAGIFDAGFGITPSDADLRSSTSPFDDSRVHLVLDGDLEVISVGFFLAGMVSNDHNPSQSTDFSVGGVERGCMRTTVEAENGGLSVFVNAPGF